uniref:Retrovirus-related Pol polyprotein from transposon TNT 1-94 n=1 Tax=Tanacetum cinerariifolium TaxID=118510 RepID=A0A6L2JVH8_TANCI|nr:hypothetical protein [Tanacetum cinerariifolium]
MPKQTQRLKKGTEIGIQEKSIMLLDESEMFTSSEGETITSYFKRLLMLINNLDRNKLTLKTVHTNLKFFNHLQPKWTHFVTRVKQSMDLYIVDYNKIYDYLKQNQFEANEMRATRIAKSHDPLALYSKTPATTPYALMETTTNIPFTNLYTKTIITSQQHHCGTTNN